MEADILHQHASTQSVPLLVVQLTGLNWEQMCCKKSISCIKWSNWFGQSLLILLVTSFFVQQVQPASLIPRSPIPIQLFDFCTLKNSTLCVQLDACNTSPPKSSVSPCLHIFGHSTFSAPKFFFTILCFFSVFFLFVAGFIQWTTFIRILPRRHSPAAKWQLQRTFVTLWSMLHLTRNPLLKSALKLTWVNILI